MPQTWGRGLSVFGGGKLAGAFVCKVMEDAAEISELIGVGDMGIFGIK